MTIVEYALELVPNDSRVGLGSGRAAQAFVRALGERIRLGGLRVHGVATSEETAKLAQEQGIPLLTLAEAGMLELAIDGADEVWTGGWLEGRRYAQALSKHWLPLTPM